MIRWSVATLSLLSATTSAYVETGSPVKNCAVDPAPSAWHSIKTAPKDKTILLGLLTEDGFLQGIGYWEVRDELGAGIWSTQEWWGQPPTHWSPIPSPPNTAVMP